MLSEPVAVPETTDLSAHTAFSTTLLTALQALSLELDSVRHESGPEVSARLAGAEDELAAIHDEMRQQQQEIGELLTGVSTGRAGMLRRFLSTLPLATLVTNPVGLILEANAAAHAALRIPLGGLTGKPVFAFIGQGDRRRLRSLLSQVGSRDELFQAAALVTPRHGTAVNSHLALVQEPDLETAAMVTPEPSADPVAAVGPQSRDEPPPTGPAVRWVILPDVEAFTGPPSHEQLEALTRLCRLGVESGDLRSTLGTVTRLCRQAIAEADHVSLLVGNPLEPSMAVTSSATAQHLDGLQHARAAGPSFDAYRSRRPMALDGDAVARHPGLADDEQAQEVRSLLALPLVTDDLATGVLTVYATGVKSVATLVALRQVMPFVEAAQTLIRDTQAYEEMRRTQEQLESALTSRAVIDQAKGMIMISLKCTADDAFSHLVRMSSTRHEKVREVAQSMVDEVLKKQRSRPPASPSE